VSGCRLAGYEVTGVPPTRRCRRTLSSLAPLGRLLAAEGRVVGQLDGMCKVLLPLRVPGS
jgi:hypothetical protein